MIVFGYFVAGQERRRFSFAHAVAFESDAVGVVNNAIQNRIGQSGFSNHFVPCGHRKLSCDQGRFPSISLLEDFEQIEALSVIQGMGSQSSNTSN